MEDSFLEQMSSVRKVCQPMRRPFTLLLGLLGLCCLIHLYLSTAHFSTPIFSLGSSDAQGANSSRCSCLQENEELKDFRGIKFYSERGISNAYANHHVGFPDMEHVNCQMAISTPTRNDVYPQSVNRTRDPQILKDAQNCSFFVNKYGFNRYPRPSAEEEDFPIAFIILFHKDLDQILFFLRAIYRLHNVYCLSIDIKSSLRFLYATRAVARCLPNVFVSSKLEDIVYAGMSRLMADINCFQDLVKHPVKWQYVINSPGQQFPLKTNLEMVQILKLFNGTNDILGKTGVKVEPERHQQVYEEIFNEDTGLVELKNTGELHLPPPFGMRVIKCSAYGSFSRPFVQFVLTSKLAKDLLEWCKPIYSPDERYWGMINYNHIEPAPGGFLGDPSRNSWVTSFTAWEDPTSSNCRSTFVRHICIFSPADLPFLVNLPYLFANKLKISHHPAALHCLDQHIFNNTVAGTKVDIATYRGILKNRFTAKPDTLFKKIFEGT